MTATATPRQLHLPLRARERPPAPALRAYRAWRRAVEEAAALAAEVDAVQRAYDDDGDDCGLDQDGWEALCQRAEAATHRAAEAFAILVPHVPAWWSLV
jgi:hypothetical protein